MIHDLSLLVRVGTGTGGAMSFGSYHGDDVPITAIRGCPDSLHLPGGKWLGTARPRIGPGTGAVEWTRHTGCCQGGLSCVWVCVCVFKAWKQFVCPEEPTNRALYSNSS